MADQRPLQGRKLGDRRVVVDRPHARYFQYLGPGVLEAKLEAQAPRTPYQRRSKDDAGRGGGATQTSRRSLQPRRRERSDSDPPCALHPVHSTGRPSRQTIADIADLCHSSTNDQQPRSLDRAWTLVRRAYAGRSLASSPARPGPSVAVPSPSHRPRVSRG